MVQDSMKVVDSTIALVRRLATELRPELLDALGLPAAIEWHTNQFQRRTGILCTVLVSDTPLGISGDQKIAVLCEARSNGLQQNLGFRHAQRARI
jgi:signal transduction histidine kinase